MRLIFLPAVSTPRDDFAGCNVWNAVPRRAPRQAVPINAVLLISPVRLAIQRVTVDPLVRVVPGHPEPLAKKL